MSLTFSSRMRAYFFIASLAALLLSLGSCGGNKKPDVHPADNKGKDTSHTASAGDTSSSPAVSEFQSAQTVTDTLTKYTFRLTPHAGDVYSYRVTRKGS